jgi:hypothetical protein
MPAKTTDAHRTAGLSRRFDLVAALVLLSFIEKGAGRVEQRALRHVWNDKASRCQPLLVRDPALGVKSLLSIGNCNGEAGAGKPRVLALKGPEELHLDGFAVPATGCRSVKKVATITSGVGLAGVRGVGVFEAAELPPQAASMKHSATETTTDGVLA